MTDALERLETIRLQRLDEITAKERLEKQRQEAADAKAKREADALLHNMLSDAGLLYMKEFCIGKSGEKKHAYMFHPPGYWAFMGVMDAKTGIRWCWKDGDDVWTQLTLADVLVKCKKEES